MTTVTREVSTAENADVRFVVSFAPTVSLQERQALDEAIAIVVTQVLDGTWWA